MAEVLDPQQIDFLKYYLDPKEKDTYSNAYQSAIKAKYSDTYAKTIVSRELGWVSESVRRRKRILNKAEAKGENLIDSEDEKVSADMVKHFTKTLGKEYYSDRTEITGAGGKDLFKPSEEDQMLVKKALDSLE